MVRPKTSGSKKSKRAGGIDFKKIKHKIGRKLPPPKNATNTQIKSKAIVLPEQSVVSERTGLAVSSRGLTLRELLQQTSHHSAKTRKFALTGIRDLLLKHPSELKLHKLILIEKLRERICDNDRAVRETLYHLLKTVIFPGIKEEITGPVISLMMAYLFNAMTHLALDIRLMAFKFFHLIVLNHSSSFLLYAEKVLDCYGDILRNMQLYLGDKSRVKDVLGGLLQFLSSFAYSKEKIEPQYGEGNATWRPLHAFGSELRKDHTGLSSITKKLEGLLPLLINCFQEFHTVVHTMPTIDMLSFNCMLCILQIINLAVEFSVAEKDQMHRASGVSVPSLFKSHDTGNFSICESLKKLWEIFPVSSIHESMEKDNNKIYILNIRIAEIFFYLHGMMDDTMVSNEKFLEFIEDALCRQIYGNPHSGMMINEKYFVSVIELIPSLVSQMSGCWKARLLKAFTSTFQSCRVDSKVMMACLCALVGMLLPREKQDVVLLDFSSQELLQYQVAWLCKLPHLLLRLGDKHPSLSKVILELQLRIGQCSVHQSPLAIEYDNLQLTLKEFYVTYDDLGARHYGSFVQLPTDCQEIAICGLYYFSRLDPSLLEALTFCCLCNQLEPTMLMRIFEVLNSMWKSGSIKLADHIGFLITLVARFKVFPGYFFNPRLIYGDTAHVDREVLQGTLNVIGRLAMNEDSRMKAELEMDPYRMKTGTYANSQVQYAVGKVTPEKLYYGKETTENISNRETFKAVTEAVFSCLSEIGDQSLVLKLLQRTMLNEMSLKPHLDNMRVMLTLIVRLDFRPSIFLEANSILGQYVSAYLIEASYYLPENMDVAVHKEEIHIHHFYVKPCISLFLRSGKLLSEVLNSFSSHSSAKNDFEQSEVYAVASTVLCMLRDAKLRSNLSSSKGTVKNILHGLYILLSESRSNIALEKRQKMQSVFEQLKTEACKLQGWSNVCVEEIGTS